MDPVRLKALVAAVSIAGVVGVSGALILHSPTPAPCQTHASYPGSASQVTITETGLPDGVVWTLSLQNNVTGHFSRSSGTDSVVLDVPPGDYNLTVFSVTSGSNLYVSSPSSRCVVINAPSLSLPVLFNGYAEHQVSFVAEDVSPDSGWGISVVGGPGIRWSVGTANGTINLTLPEGSYRYQVENASNGSGFWRPEDPNGTFQVGDANLTIEVPFVAVPGYYVTFSETGLPAGTYWCVDLSRGGSQVGECAPYASFELFLEEGKYSLTVQSVVAENVTWLPNPVTEKLTVTDATTVDVTYTGPPAAEVLEPR